jgi:hypothetical protein
MSGENPPAGGADEPTGERTDERDDGARPDPAELERLLDALVDEGVVVERADGTLARSESFTGTWDVYYDTYGDATEETFRETVGELFDLSPAAAANRIEEEGVTREMLVAYLSVRSALDGSYPQDDLARMAGIVDELSPETPVPDAVEALDDASYEAFVSSHVRAVVTVWRRNCAPCDAVKESLPAVLDALPEGAAVGGVDGEAVTAFRRAYDVDAAPAMLLFEDGTLLETLRGRFTADQVAVACDRVYD